MELHTTMRQHSDSGRVARRILWISVIGAMVVAGYLTAPPSQDERVSAIAPAAAKWIATRGPDEAVSSPPAPTNEITPSPRIEGAVQHQALDPAEAGHDVAPFEATAMSADGRRWDTTSFTPAKQGASVGAGQSAVALPLRLYPEPASDAVQDDNGHPPSF